jgi:hypothetical protein
VLKGLGVKQGGCGCVAQHGLRRWFLARVGQKSCHRTGQCNSVDPWHDLLNQQTMKSCGEWMKILTGCQRCYSMWPMRVGLAKIVASPNPTGCQRELFDC